MRKKLVMMTLASCILASTFSLTVCAEPVKVMAEELVYDIQNNSYSQIHSIKEEKLQKANQDLKQFKSDLKEYRRNIKLIKSDLKKSKTNYTTLKKDYKNAEKYFKNADAGLTLVQDDLSTISNVYSLIQEFFDPDMGYVQTEADLQQAESDLAEVKEYLTQTRDYLKQFKKYNKITSETFKCDLDEAKEYVDFAIKTKNSKKVKTKQKLDEKSIKCMNNRTGYETYVRYGIYDDKYIDAELKALNEYRKSKKLPELKVNKKLNKAAAILALEYALGADYEKDGVIISGMYNGIRPNGKSSTTVFKECGIKGVKSSTELNVKYSGKNEGFVDTLTGDYYSMYSKELNSKKYTEVGIGYYSSSDGSLQTWVMLPVQK